MAETTTTVTSSDVTPEEGSAGSFFAAAFDKLERDGTFEVSPEDADSNPAPADTPEPEPAAEDAPVSEESSNSPFSAANILGLKPEDESASEEGPEESTVVEDAAEDGDDTPPADVDTPEKQKTWAKLRGDLKATRGQIKERDVTIAQLQSELQQARSSAANPEELAQLRSELAAKEEALLAGNVRASKYFKDAVDVPREQIRAAAESISKKVEGVTPEQVLAALRNPEGDAMGDIAAALTEFDRIRLYRLSEDQARVDNAERVIMDRSKEAADRITAKEKADSEAKRAADRKRYEESLVEYKAKVAPVLPFLKKIEGATAWNAQMDELEAFSNSIQVDELDVPARAELVYRAALVPSLLTLLETLQKEHRGALAREARLRKGRPALGGGTPTSVVHAPGGEDDEDLGFQEVMRKRLSA